MIKAEIISHEGNPGPNWLDRCRTLATPGKATALVMVVALASLLTVTLQKDSASDINNQSGANASQQASQAPLSGLQVQPLAMITSTDNTGIATVQPAAAATPAAPAPTTDTSASDALGAKSTPSLNSTTNPSSASQKSSTDQSQLNGRTLTNNVQSTLQDLNDKLKKPFGL